MLISWTWDRFNSHQSPQVTFFCLYFRCPFFSILFIVCGCCCFYMNKDAAEFVTTKTGAASFRELYYAGSASKESMIFSQTNIIARIKLIAALTHNNCSFKSKLATKKFHA